MDLFEEKAEKLRHKLHETESTRQKREVFDLSNKPGSQGIAKFTKAWANYLRATAIMKRVDNPMRSPMTR